MYSHLTMALGFPPDYVLDEMQTYEIKAVLANSHVRTRDSWEQARMVAYVVAQCNSTKSLKPTDIIKFSWDGEASREIDLKKIEELRKMALAMEKQINERRSRK